jgi:hypothetical protein
MDRKSVYARARHMMCPSAEYTLQGHLIAQEMAFVNIYSIRTKEGPECKDRLTIVKSLEDHHEQDHVH